MPYDEVLYQRICKLLKSSKGVDSKKMFGGICFMHNGNMLCGIAGQRLMVRVGPAQYDSALKLKHASVMDFTGKPMKGFIFVSLNGTKTDASLRKWIDLGFNFTSTLKPKKAKSSMKTGGPTRLTRVKNFGPVTRAEFKSMGIETLEQVKTLGFEETCRTWVQYYPERLNANAFIGVICAIEDTVWTKATSEQRRIAHALVKEMKHDFGLPQLKRRR